MIVVGVCNGISAAMASVALRQKEADKINRTHFIRQVKQCSPPAVYCLEKRPVIILFNAQLYGASVVSTSARGLSCSANVVDIHYILQHGQNSVPFQKNGVLSRAQRFAKSR